MLVSEVMSRQVISMSTDEPCTRAARLISRYNIGAVPVCGENGRLRGIVTDRDIVLRCVASENDPDLTPVKEIMSRCVLTVGPDISWDGGEMSIRYEMDKLNFDWRMEQMSFTFVPGDIEFTVTQQPDVIIKYVGGPLYVPPSADPNYEPIDVNA